MLALFGTSLTIWLSHDFSLAGLINGEPKWVLEYQAQWIPHFGISWHLALDGLSLLMIMLTGFLGMLAVLCSWTEITKFVGFSTLTSCGSSAQWWVYSSPSTFSCFLLLGNDAGAHVLPGGPLGA